LLTHHLSTRYVAFLIPFMLSFLKVHRAYLCKSQDGINLLYISTCILLLLICISKQF
jgi:TM2 domain-containing membrane protein YozV